MNCLLNCINNNLLDYTEFAVAFQSLKLSLAQNKVDFFSKGRLKPFFAPLKYSSGVCLPQIFCAAAALCDNCASLKSAPIAQLEERQFPKLEATGSIPVGCAKFYYAGSRWFTRAARFAWLQHAKTRRQAAARAAPNRPLICV